jgi:Uma2 family endonuclease
MTMTAHAAGGRTIADLEALPDDGNRYELSDGSLLVSPSPSLRHIYVQEDLRDLLKAQAPANLRVSVAGAGLKIRNRMNYLVPDLVVFTADAAGGTGHALDVSDVRLVVEVLSPSSGRRDLIEKRQRYAAARISDYWIVDALARTVTLLTLDSDSTVYREEGRIRAGRPAPVTRPFAARLDPAEFC